MKRPTKKPRFKTMKVTCDPFTSVVSLASGMMVPGYVLHSVKRRGEVAVVKFERASR